MTWDDTIGLLQLATGYDHRQRTEAEVALWAHVAQRSRWTVDEAVAAVHEHFATSTEFLMPAHITAIIRDRRQQPATLQRAALPGAPAADPEHRRALISELAQRLHWRPRTLDSQQAAALAVECPYCHAAPQLSCTRQATRGPRQGQLVPLAGVHASRAELATGCVQR